MPISVDTWPEKDLDDQLLTFAALFEGEFSIDWVQDLSEAKATQILRAWDRFIRDGVLAEHEPGFYSFVDVEKREQLRKGLPADQREEMYNRIGGLFLDETISDDSLPQAAHQLLHIKNGLEGCRLLCRAGDYYRRKGRSAKALACYDKAIKDLETFSGIEADTLFVETVIGYAKDHRAINQMDQLLSYLAEALDRAERCNNEVLQVLVLMHLASNAFLSRNPESAARYHDRAFAMARDINYPKVERAVVTNTMISHCFSGRWKAAIEIYETLETLFSEKYPKHRLSLRVKLYLGYAYAFLGQIPQALELLNGLRAHALNMDDYDTAAVATANMGLLLTLNHNFDEAIDLLTNILADKKIISNFAKCFACYYLAYCYFLRRNPQTSHRYLLRALKISEQHNYDFKWLPYYFEICLAIDHNDYPALPGISPRDEIQRALENHSVYTRAVANRCMALLKDTDLTDEARLKHLTRSLALFEKSGHLMEIAKTKMELGRYWLRHGDKEKAGEFAAAGTKILLPIDRALIPEDLVHLVGDLRIEEHLLEEILNLGQEVVSIRGTQEVVQHIFSTVNRITGAERGAIFLKNDDPDTRSVKLWAAKNLTAHDTLQHEFLLSLEMVHRTFKDGQANIHNSELTAEGASFSNDAIKSRICVPLSLRGKTIGVLYHDNRFFQSTFKEQDIKILSYFASLAAIALDNAQAYQEIQRLNQRLHDEKQYLEEQQLESLHFDDFVAASPDIKKVLSMVQRVAKTESTVLIIGETGVGKEMVARAIHQHSFRRDRPFIRVHCSALPESLIPSELFGHERGAFTGAIERRIGRFELADGGTLFLDEIGEIPMEVQIRLLRVLQSGEFERVGGRETLHSDFRLIAATNRNLEQAVADSRFRSDLYYRLNVFPIHVPPLRERREDIAPLASHFLRTYSEKMGKSFKGTPAKEMSRLFSYHWPGNVRELENVIERGVILNAGGLFRVPELAVGAADIQYTGRLTLKEIERRAIIGALESTNWKLSGPGGAAELLDINYKTLFSRMKKLGIKKPSK